MRFKFNVKSLVLILIDIACIVLSYLVATFIRADDLMKQIEYIEQAPGEVYGLVLSLPAIAIPIIYVVVFLCFDMCTTLLRHITVEDCFSFTAANVIAAGITIVYNYLLFPMLGNFEGSKIERIPTGVVLMAAVFIFVLSVAVRAVPRIASGMRSGYLNKHSREPMRRVMIYGAGESGFALLREMQRPESKSTVVAFYDDDDEKTGSKINGIRIFGDKSGMENTVKALAIDDIVIAAPSASTAQLQAMINKCKTTGCKVKRLPSIYDMVMDSDTKATHVKDVDIADILGREETQIDVDSISGYIKGSVVLVTGAGGSIGSELCRQIIRYKPGKLILLDIYENNVYDLENELRRNENNKDVPMLTYIASVRDYKRMTDVFDVEKPDIVFHAAAHKHVPLMEFNPGEAIKNNVLGTYNSARVSSEHDVKAFVLISTDKAVNPTNIMGATKRIAEIIIQSFSKVSKTRFVAVRFGNVLGSNGSVVPLFKHQIENMGPVTVTHPDITRFFMTIPEAARLVVQAGAMAEGGEIFILDMGEPVKIDSLARDLIRLSGYVPDVDIEIKYTGLRPGEKLYEELLREEEGVSASAREGIFIAQPFIMEWSDVEKMLEEFTACINADHDTVAACIKKYVPTYKPDVDPAQKDKSEK